MGGPQSRSGHGGEEKNSQSLPGVELPITQPVAQRYSNFYITISVEPNRRQHTENFIYIYIYIYIYMLFEKGCCGEYLDLRSGGWLVKTA
jgi:hypothetical protein